MSYPEHVCLLSGPRPSRGSATEGVQAKKTQMPSSTEQNSNKQTFDLRPSEHSLMDTTASYQWGFIEHSLMDPTELINTYQSKQGKPLMVLPLERIVLPVCNGAVAPPYP